MKIFARIILAIFISLIFISVLIVSDGLIDNKEKSDIIVILGNKVELDGSPSLRLKSRLDKGYNLYSKGFAPLILVSGGIGKEGYDEAVIMKEYLVKAGIPEEKIITDSNGVDSYNTAKNTKQTMKDMNLKTVLIVSNYYHISRTRLAFKNFEIEKISGVHAPYFEIRDLYSIPREIAGYLYYLFRKY